MGWKLIPNNFLLVGQWYVITGTASTSQPIENLNDPHHWNQAWITADGSGTVLLKCVLSNVLLSNNDWAITAVGGVNHNADGTTFTCKNYNPDSGATNNYGLGTTFFSAGFDVTAGNPNFLATGASSNAQGWYFNFASLGAGYVLKIGNLVAGPYIDLGDPVRGDAVTFAPTAPAVQTQAGYTIHGRIQDPQVVKSVRFEMPTSTTKNVIWAKGSTSAGVSYNTLQRGFQYGPARSHAGASTIAAGLSAAGGSLPILYNEGTNYDTGATLGRPAYYGMWNIQIERNIYRSISAVNAQITDLLPTGSEVKPTSN